VDCGNENGKEASEQEAWGNQGMVPKESAPEAKRATREADSQTEGPLRLLRHYRQLAIGECFLQRGSLALVLLVETALAAATSHLEQVPKKAKEGVK
jgi:hypothetical protein